MLTKPKSKRTLAREMNAIKKMHALFETCATNMKFSKSTARNVVQCFNHFQNGRINKDNMRKCGELIVIEKLKNFQDFKGNSETTPFDRITALKFHPTIPYTLGIGCKNGRFIVRHLETYYRKEEHTTWDKIGSDCSITDFSFNPFTPHSVLTTSIDGVFQVRNYSRKTSNILLATHSLERWFSSVAVSAPIGQVLVSDNNGYVGLLNKDFRVICCLKMHKKKVNSIDISKNCASLFATASVDKTVKIWDSRMIKLNSPINCLKHVDPVNSAYFSQSNGLRLLTTDSFYELRVYRWPTFDLEQRIPHPHRPYPHLTPIKATWHPFCDVIVVGRYPDPRWPIYKNELESVDIISCETSSIEGQLDSLSRGVVSLTSFNCTGEILAVSSGSYLLYEKGKIPEDE